MDLCRLMLPLLLCAAPVAPLAHGVETPELIPREVFFGNPERSGVQISPDGTRLGWLAADEGVMNVWVGTIGADDAMPVTAARERPIRSWFWAPNGEQVIYAQDRAGDENFRLFAVDVLTGEEVALTPEGAVQARVENVDRERPDEIVVAINDRDPRFHDLWTVNLRSGERTELFRNEEGWIGVGTDHDFVPRLASRLEFTGGLTVFTRDSAEDPWYELVRWSAEDVAASGPIGFSRDGRTIYLRDSRGVDTGELRAYTRPESAEEDGSYETIASDPRADVADVVFDPATGRPQAVAFDYDRRTWSIVDARLHEDWRFLDGVADGEMDVVSRDRADRLWVVGYQRDDGPYAYYLYDRGARSASFLFSSRPALEGLPLAKMRPVVIPARDGLKLVSYLTLPVGDLAQRRLPMILLVHGGPWARDSWGYNSLHQWLANRGYAVLSVNFRGSTGFGKSFVNAGNREWAARMHDDLIDAVGWAVAEQIADPARVAIMGGSYGGYATLVGLAMTPEFFAAGVDIVGPSHVKTLIDSIPPYWEPIRQMFDTRVAPLDDDAYLDRISPLTRVDEIRRPLLIGQGANDPRVKEAESRQIVDAMEAKGIPVTYVLFPDEGHGFARPENSQAFFAVTEVFLAEHLGGRAQPIESAVRTSSAQVEAGATLIPGLSEE